MVSNGRFEFVVFGTNTLNYFTVPVYGTDTSNNSYLPNWTLNTTNSSSNLYVLNGTGGGFNAGLPPAIGSSNQCFVAQHMGSLANVIKLSQSVYLYKGSLILSFYCRYRSITAANPILTVNISNLTDTILSTTTVSVTGSWVKFSYNLNVTTESTYTLLFTFTSTNNAGSTDNSTFLTDINISPTPPYPCFLQGTRILCMNTETDCEEYIAVEKLRRGDLVKTLLNGYKAITHIGHTRLPNPATDTDKRNRLYRFSKSKCPEVNRDLYITGEHCTLRLDLTYAQVERIKDHMGRYYITDKQFRCPACLDERAEPYDREDKPVTIWHFALEHYDPYLNYGVYANGLLVESCSIEYLVKKSNMKLISGREGF